MTLNLDPATATDFTERLRLRFDIALAQLDADLMQADQPAEVHSFVPRAAKTDAVALPEMAEAETDENLTVHFAQRGTTLEVRVEAMGFHRIDEVAGRRALMTSQNSVVYYEFAFDDEGSATFSLQSSPQAVEDLAAGWSILIAPKL